MRLGKVCPFASAEPYSLCLQAPAPNRHGLGPTDFGTYSSDKPFDQSTRFRHELGEDLHAEHRGVGAHQPKDGFMPEVNSARNPLPVGEKPDIKRSSSEARLDHAGDTARRVQEEERQRVKEKTERLRKARLEANKPK